jgi:amidohydrolase
MIDKIKDLKNYTSELIDLRRDLHRIPEAGFKEIKTSKFIEKKLREFGLDVKTGIANTGLVGNIYSENPSSEAVMIRADMDGLPVIEKTGLDYASRHEGFMHACGHDGHMAIALIVAKILARHRNLLKANVKFVFQPAEESPGGAKPMIDAGVLKNPDVKALVGLHIWTRISSGKIGIRKGPIMASVNYFKLKITGKGTHGAMPHEGVDAIVAAGKVIDSLQTIVSREINPVSPCVLTVGKINGGTAFNILAGEVELEGTVRTLDQSLNEIIAAKIKRVIKGVTQSMGAGYKFDFKYMYPVTVNDSKITDIVCESAIEAAGAENVIEPQQTMGGDDISFYLQKVPGCYFFLGGSGSDQGLNQQLHSNLFNFDENCLPLGVETLVKSVFKLL